MFGHRAVRPDPALLARVSDSGDVDLGTYPEDVLAVTGAYPARGSLGHRPEGSSSFRRLDSHARQAAMQAALDRLAAEGTIAARPGSSLKDVVTAGLDGKLAVTGPMADLYRLSLWIHRKGVRSGMVVSMTTTEGLGDVAMPPGAPVPGVETCFAVPAPDDRDVVLVERCDGEASTRRYTLRTPRREFSQMAAFLFADVITPDEALQAHVKPQFRFGQRSVTADFTFLRTGGENVAHGRIILSSPRKKNQEPRYIKVSAAELADVMTKYYRDVAARTQ